MREAEGEGWGREALRELCWEGTGVVFLGCVLVLVDMELWYIRSKFGKLRKIRSIGLPDSSSDVHY